MKIHGIIQARCGSTRFPNKVFAEIDGKPLIWHVVNRLTYAKTIDKIIIATTNSSMDDAIEDWCVDNGVCCYRGSENDVLNRYYCASMMFPSDVIVRITADDPFKEPEIIDRVVSMLLDGDYDIVTNNFPPSFPEGLDCEAFLFAALEQSEKSVCDPFEREHVTQYMYKHPNKFKIGNVVCNTNMSYLRWTIDNHVDLDMVKAIYEHRNSENKGVLLMDEILGILQMHPEILEINSSVERSLMYKKQ